MSKLPKGNHYFGRILVSFGLKKIPPSDLFLDFRGVSISNYSVNGNKISDNQVFKNHKIIIPTSFLHSDLSTNKLEVYVYSKYRKDGCGLHSFEDSSDQTQYLYT